LILVSIPHGEEADGTADERPDLGQRDGQASEREGRDEEGQAEDEANDSYALG